jgi:ketosteroid isomerase-like protein
MQAFTVDGLTEIWHDWAQDAVWNAPKPAASTKILARIPTGKTQRCRRPIFIPLEKPNVQTSARFSTPKRLNMRFFLMIAGLGLCTACQTTPSAAPSPAEERAVVADVLNQWHRAASLADSTAYFGAMVPDSAVFIGTDDTEYWTLEDFKTWSRPHFKNGKGWTFQPTVRKIHFHASTAYVTEQLDSPHMGACRGTAVLQKTDGTWKIALYSLSFSVPNPRADAVMEAIKSPDFPSENRTTVK